MIEQPATIRVEPRDGAWWAIVQSGGAVDERGPFAAEAGAWATLGNMKALKRGKKRINHIVVYLSVLTCIILSILGIDNFWGSLASSFGWWLLFT